LRDLVQVGAMNKPDEIRAAEKLIHQLKATPGLADQLLDELRGEADDSPLASALLGILGAAGTPAAQADLFAVASSEDLPASFREMALFSYVQTGAPMPEADALLEGLYTQGGDLANTALLVLGAVGDKVRDSDPARFQQISDYVVGVLNTPGLSLNDYIAALNAVGNLGPSQVPAAVAQAAQSDNSLVRLNAIGSLARVTTDAALTLVMNAITNDPSPDVQAVAVKTLAAEKGAAAIGDLSAVATSGDSTAARQQALTQLAAFAATNPNVVTVITTAAQKDPAQEVRDYANQLLGMLNGNTQNAMVPAGQ
jgi:HEAT repeat protein